MLNSEFVIVGEDASSPPLSQLYRGPYKVVDRKIKYFKLQIGSKLDNISVDRLKPVFPDEKVSPALPLPCGRPPRHPSPPASKPLSPVKITKKSVCLSLLYPPQATKIRSFVSALLPTLLLGGVL